MVKSEAPPPPSCGVGACVVFLVALIAGTVSTLSSKVILAMTTTDSEGNEVTYKKPLMQTFIMFLAMTLALPLFYGFLVATGRALPRVERRMWFILAVPACTDMLGTVLNMIGLLYVTVSVYQLLRCFVIVFVAVLKTFVLNRKLKRHHWQGVALNAAAVFFVSSSALFDPASGPEVIFGIACITFSCLVRAAQMVIEEKLMSGSAAGSDETPPLVVVGMEGFWGSVIMLAIIFPMAYVLPGDDHGSYENFYESCVGIWNNPDLFRITLGFLVTITTFNVAAIFVTFLLDSVWRSILENFRPIAIWGADLALFYMVTKGTFGEAWTDSSWLELAGLCVLLIGTATYNGSIRWCGASSDDGDDGEEEEFLAPTPDRFASPMISKSPGYNRNAHGGPYQSLPTTHQQTIELGRAPAAMTTDDLPQASYQRGGY